MAGGSKLQIRTELEIRVKILEDDIRKLVEFLNDNRITFENGKLKTKGHINN